MSTKKTDIAYLNDFQTPPPVCKYMVSLLPPGVKKVMEPTPGQGNLVRAYSLGNRTGDFDHTSARLYILGTHFLVSRKYR